MAKPMSRRAFVALGTATVSVVGGTPALAKSVTKKTPQPARAPADFPLTDTVPHRGERRFHLINGHIDESLDLVYYRDGQYLPDAMHRIAVVMRDHMANKIHPIDPHLIDLLGDLHGAIGSSEPWVLISGYRSPQTNAYLRRHSGGVAAHSLHMRGLAADVMLEDESIENLHNCALEMARGGVGYYPRSSFVHVDTGAVREWKYG
jgi:uncharacterized protein YcbK (DUF882 family)